LLKRPAGERFAPRFPERRSAMNALVWSMLGIALLATCPATAAATPPNDTPADAIAIGLADLPFTDRRDVTDATADPSGPRSCFGSFAYVPQRSVWYTFSAPDDAIIEIDTLGSTYDTSLAVTTSCGASCTRYAECADDSGGEQSQVTLDATAGTVYRIMVELQEGAACPAEGCQLVLNVRRAREHTLELRVNASAPDCYVGTSLRASRPSASDSDYRSGTGSAAVTVTGVGSDFYVSGWVSEFCTTYTRPLTGSLWLDGERVGRLENELAAARSLSIYGDEIQEGADGLASALAADEPDVPTGSLAATMRTRTTPACRARAGVYASIRLPSGDSDSWSNDRERRKLAQATIPVDPGDFVSFTFGGESCADGAKIKGAPSVGGQSVGSGWLKLRSTSASLGGLAPAPIP
jgi:hypothetical protein